MKHVLITDPGLNGWEYGMLRAFEAAIVKNTGAAVLELPAENEFVKERMGQSMRLGTYRKHLPKKPLPVEADVIWCILMGPENYRLDMFKNWMKQAKYRIVYLFDTLDSQFELIKKLFSDDVFNIKITSFNDAVQYLEQLTGKNWHCIEQAVPEELFTPVAFEERIIHFSSYGRRLPSFHEVLVDFCKKKNLYLDYTTHDANHPTADAEDLYRQYAWHLQHSLFTISWPVEITNPARAGRLRPVTCRWFEAASAGTIILGQTPANNGFNDILDPMLVVSIDYTQGANDIMDQLEAVWERRKFFFENAQTICKQKGQLWTWQYRVSQIQEIVHGL